jgi:4-amino-4-deoxy-L-arabinose transferase-like glycosyltransferase
MTVGLAFLLLVAAGGSVWIIDRMRRPGHRLQRLVAVGVVLLLFAPVALLYGPWAYMTIRCRRQPVAISDFAASYSYKLPGDHGYRRESFLQDYVCSEAEARRKGYERGGE